MTSDTLEPSDEAWRLAVEAFGASADEECAYRMERFIRAGMPPAVILELCRRGRPSGWAADAWAEVERDIETLAGRAFIDPGVSADHVTNLGRAVHTLAAPSGHAVEYAIARASFVLTTIVDAGSRLVAAGARLDAHDLEVGRLLRPSFRAQADAFRPRARHLVEAPPPAPLPGPSTTGGDLFASFARRDGFTERAIDIAYDVGDIGDLFRPKTRCSTQPKRAWRSACQIASCRGSGLWGSQT